MYKLLLLGGAAAIVGAVLFFLASADQAVAISENHGYPPKGYR